MTTIVSAAVLALVLQSSIATASPAKSPQPPVRPRIFTFHTDEFWLNLHHFLYVLGRAEAKTADSSRAAVSGAPADAERGLAALGDEERRVWREAVATYAAGPSLKDAVFDDSLSATTRTLAGAEEDARVPAGAIDGALRAVLERAAPIYRKAFWPAHREANRTWRDAMQGLVDRHGRTILAFITRAYGMRWPAAGYDVHLSAYANWSGAYSTKGHLLVLSSLDDGTRGMYGLETVFHEGMHQWDDQVEAALEHAARRTRRQVPRDLSHAMIFFTAGEAVRRVAPGHVPYADAFGVWRRGMTSLDAALEKTWKPYLDGRGTRDDALLALVAESGAPLTSGRPKE